MPHYRIYILDSADQVVGGCPGEFLDDAAAEAAAQIKLKNCGEIAEIVSESGRVTRLAPVRTADVT